MLAYLPQILIAAIVLGVVVLAIGAGVFLYLRGKPRREAKFAALMGEQRRLEYKAAEAVTAPPVRNELHLHFGDRPVEEIQQILRGSSYQGVMELLSRAC